MNIIGEVILKFSFAHSLGFEREGKHSRSFRCSRWRPTVRRRAFAVKIGRGLQKEKERRKEEEEKNISTKRTEARQLLKLAFTS